jgi:hypothetical protein
MPATAYQSCTGPVNLFWAPNGSSNFAQPSLSAGSALYLGTCAQYPLVQGVKNWSPTYNDRGGPVPFDQQYFGDTKTIIADLQKMVQANVSALIDQGVVDQTDMGAFKWQSGIAFTLWLQFEYYGTAAATPGLPPGEVYFNCSIPETGYDPLGTRNQVTRIIVNADRGYVVVGNDKQFWSYSTDAGYFSGLPAVA